MTVAADPSTSLDLDAVLSPASFWAPDRLGESTWLPHAPFAFWVMAAARPKRLVELGTGHGFSYLAFCQAARRLALDTRCCAVDSWAGDGQAGDQAYRELKTYHDPRYADFSQLTRASVDDAAATFADRSIDILHIDTVDRNVKDLYESWRPKLSGRAIVLLHATNGRDREAGRLWSELAAQHPQFEFLHGRGLGVLGVGEDLPAALRAFFSTAAQHGNFVRESYFRLGMAIQADGRQPAPPAAAAPPSLAPSAPRKPGDFHIHVAAMAPRFLEVRTVLPLQELAKVPGISTSLSEKKIDLPRLPVEQPKIVVLQRLGLGSVERWREIIGNLAGRGWVVVAELDDHPDLVGAVHNREVDDSAWHLVRFAHGAQTSTLAMADAIQPHNPEVVAFPNAAFAIATHRPSAGGRLRVFFGALNRERFSRQIGAALSAYATAHPDIEFVVVHDQAFFEALGSAKKSFSAALPYDKYLEQMAGCDVVLMPLEGGAGERYKSDVKFIEASSLGLASIASPVVYGDTIEHDRTGLIVQRPEDWPTALAALHRDPALRLRLASAAQAYVEDSRMFQQQVERRLGWYRDLWTRRQPLTAALSNRFKNYAA